MKLLSEILKTVVFLAVMLAATYGVYKLAFKPKPLPPPVHPVVVDSTGRIDTLRVATPADSVATVRNLKKRISEYQHQVAGLNAEVETLKARHVGTVTDTILMQQLDSIWPMIAVKFTPTRIVWTSYSQALGGVIADGYQSLHAHRATVTATPYGGVIVKQPEWELGYCLKLGAKTPYDNLKVVPELEVYGTLIRGQVSYGVGVGCNRFEKSVKQSLDIRAMVQVQSY